MVPTISIIETVQLNTFSQNVLPEPAKQYFHTIFLTLGKWFILHPIYISRKFIMLIEENLPLASTEELNELLIHMESLYKCHKQLRESYSNLHHMTKFIMNNFSWEGRKVGELIETLGQHGVSTYSRYVELIREELGRREVKAAIEGLK